MVIAERQDKTRSERQVFGSLIRHAFFPQRPPGSVIALPGRMILPPLGALLVPSAGIPKVPNALFGTAPTRAETVAPITPRTEEEQLSTTRAGTLDNSQRIAGIDGGHVKNWTNRRLTCDVSILSDRYAVLTTELFEGSVLLHRALFFGPCRPPL